jgi:hypothetical protein
MKPFDGLMMRREQAMAWWKSGEKKGKKEREDGCFYIDEAEVFAQARQLLSFVGGSVTGSF